MPTNALDQTRNGAQVFVVTHGDVVQQRTVMVGETLDGRAIIEKGLQPGEVVVTQGQYDLTDGTKVVQVPAGDPHVQNSTPASQGMLG